MWCGTVSPLKGKLSSLKWDITTSVKAALQENESLGGTAHLLSVSIHCTSHQRALQAFLLQRTASFRVGRELSRAMLPNCSIRSEEVTAQEDQRDVVSQGSGLSRASVLLQRGTARSCLTPKDQGGHPGIHKAVDSPTFCRYPQKNI